MSSGPVESGCSSQDLVARSVRQAGRCRVPRAVAGAHCTNHPRIAHNTISLLTKSPVDAAVLAVSWGFQAMKDAEGRFHKALTAAGLERTGGRLIVALLECSTGRNVEVQVISQRDHNCRTEWRARFDRHSEFDKHLVRQEDERGVAVELDCLHFLRQLTRVLLPELVTEHFAPRVDDNKERHVGAIQTIQELPGCLVFLGRTPTHR